MPITFREYYRKRENFLKVLSGARRDLDMFIEMVNARFPGRYVLHAGPLWTSARAGRGSVELRDLA